MLSLINLLELEEIHAVETAEARFYLPLPEVAPFAFLHTIFKPASTDMIELISASIPVPQMWKKFLSVQNGADLFSGAIYLYGVNDPLQLLDRSSNYATSPFSIWDLNITKVLKRFPNWTQVGSYGFDGSRILASRDDNSVKLVDRSGESQLAFWSDIEDFLAKEVERLGVLYSPSGKLLTERVWTVPRKVIHI